MKFQDNQITKRFHQFDVFGITQILFFFSETDRTEQKLFLSGYEVPRGCFFVEPSYFQEKIVFVTLLLADNLELKIGVFGEENRQK